MKILITNDFGAGWSTWNTPNEDLRKFLLTYQPIIDFIEAGNTFTHNDCHNPNEVHPLLQQLTKDITDRWEDLYFYLGGAENLTVRDIEQGSAFRVNDYDGKESIELLCLDNFDLAL